MLPWRGLLLAQSTSVPLETFDFVILVVTVLAVSAFGMWVGRKEKGTGRLLSGRQEHRLVGRGRLDLRHQRQLASHGRHDGRRAEGRFCPGQLRVRSGFRTVDDVLLLPALLSADGGLHAFGIPGPAVRRSQPAVVFDYEHGCFC